MVTAVGALSSTKSQFSQPLSQLISQSLSVVASSTSLLQTLNLQNPNSASSLLERVSPHLNPALVIQVINNQTSPDHALFFFKWASNPNPNPNSYSHTHHCYIAITDLLISHGLFSAAFHLLESSNKLSDFMVGKFIKAHGDRGHIRSAIHLFHSVRKRESGRCLFSYNSILGVLVRANQINLARAYFGQIVKDGAVKSDVSTYTTLIRGFCKVGMIRDAHKMFVEMDCLPNLVTYNIMVNGFCKKGLIENARRIVDRMTESKDCLPDTVTYTTLIDGYCKKGKLDEAKRCFDEMRSSNCEPNVLTYNAMIDGLCLSGSIDEAKRMLTRMRLNGLKDNVATQTSLLKGYCVVGRSHEAVEHLKEMVSLRMEPDVKMYGVVVNEFCKLRKPNEAIALLGAMKARGINPKVSSFNAVFRILVGSGELDRAILLLKQMPQMGCFPNFLSFNTVICGLVAAKRRMSEVEGLVCDMLRASHDLDATLYGCLVEGYCEDGNEEMAMQVLWKMIGRGYVINLETFLIFVKKLCAKAKVFEVEKFIEQMSQSCRVTDVDGYRRVLGEYLCNIQSHIA